MTREKGCAWIDEEYGEADVCLTCGDDTTWPCRPYLMQRSAELEAAVTRVRELADSWTGRGEHLLAYAKTAPDDVADALLESGTDWVDKARMLRSAVDEACILRSAVDKVAAELNARVCGPENSSMRVQPAYEVRTQPTQTCQTCGNTEVVRPDGRGFPPDIARRRLEKRCRAAGHACVPRYTAGLVLAPRTGEGDVQ